MGATFPLEQIPALSQMLMLDDPQAQFNATQQCRKLLSVQQSPPIQEFIAAGVVPRFVQFLKEINRPDLQFEASWCSRTLLLVLLSRHVSLLNTAHYRSLCNCC